MGKSDKNGDSGAVCDLSLSLPLDVYKMEVILLEKLIHLLCHLALVFAKTPPLPSPHILKHFS